MWACTRLLSMAVLCGLVTPAAQADPVADFYKGKEIRLIIGQPPGGGYDTFARLFARHLGRLMPGNPIVIPQNMPGAAGMAMTNSLVAIQPRDGTVIGAASGQIGTAALFGAPGARYDARELGWIGSLNSEVGLVVARKDVPVKRFADLLDHELIVGASFATDSNVIYPTTMNAVLGTKFKIVTGYPGGNDINLAMENGEVGGRASAPWATWKATRPDWVRDGKIVVIAQIGLTRAPDLPDVPLLTDLTGNDGDRAVVKLVSAPSTIGRPVFTAPGVPTPVVATLRKAFTAMVQDKTFNEEAAREKLDINPVSGEELQKIVEDLVATPKPVADRLATIFKSQ